MLPCSKEVNELGSTQRMNAFVNEFKVHAHPGVQRSIDADSAAASDAHPRRTWVSQATAMQTSLLHSEVSVSFERSLIVRGAASTIETPLTDEAWLS